MPGFKEGESEVFQEQAVVQKRESNTSEQSEGVGYESLEELRGSIEQIKREIAKSELRMEDGVQDSIDHISKKSGLSQDELELAKSDSGLKSVLGSFYRKIKDVCSSYIQKIEVITATLPSSLEEGADTSAIKGVLDSKAVSGMNRRDFIKKMTGLATAMIVEAALPKEAMAGVFEIPNSLERSEARSDEPIKEKEISDKEKLAAEQRFRESLVENYELMDNVKAIEFLREKIKSSPVEMSYLIVDGQYYIEKEKGHKTFLIVDVSMLEDAAKGGANVVLGHIHPEASFMYSPEELDDEGDKKNFGYMPPSEMDVNLAILLKSPEFNDKIISEVMDPNGKWKFTADMNNQVIMKCNDLIRESRGLGESGRFEKEILKHITQDELNEMKKHPKLVEIIQNTDPRELTVKSATSLGLSDEKERVLFEKIQLAIDKVLLEIISKYDMKTISRVLVDYKKAAHDMGKSFSEEEREKKKQEIEEFLEFARDMGIILEYTEK